MGAYLPSLIALSIWAIIAVLIDARGRRSTTDCQEDASATNLPAGIEVQHVEDVGYLIVPRSISTTQKEYTNVNPTVF